MKQGGDGGVLTGYLGTDWIRAIVYKHFDIHLSDDRSGKYLLLFAQRTTTRQWRDPELVLHHIKCHFNKVSIE